MNGTFEELVASNTPVLIDFSAEWCGPCKVLNPILKQLAQDMGDAIKIIKIDIDKNPALQRKFKISGVPTLMVFKNSQQKWRKSGVIPLAQLKQVMQSYI